MHIDRYFEKKESSIIIVSILLLSTFLITLPQTQAVKPQPSSISVTLTSPNPLASVTGSGIAGGMYGETVACGGNYIFVYGEGNFYVYNAKAKVLINTIAGSTIAIGSGYVAIGNPDFTSTTSKVVIYQINNLRKPVATLTAPDDFHVGFGLSIAIANGKMLISDVGTLTSVHPYSGDVYVYSIPSFSYLTTLEQANPERAYGDPFGYSIAFCGNHIVVGAPDQTVNGAIFAGNVYLYNSETYALEKTIPNPEANAAAAWGLFGESIAVSGNNIWIGEPGFTYPATSSASEISLAGKVYCYNTNGEQVATLNTQNPAQGGLFGSSIAANNAYVVVGARGESVDVASSTETTTISYAGQVYVYTASGTFLKTLTSPNPQSSGLFGYSVALGHGYYVVGAPEENSTVRYRSTTQTYFEAGQAYVLS